MSDEQARTRDVATFAAEETVLSHPRAAPTVVVPLPRPPAQPPAAPQRGHSPVRGRAVRALAWALVPVLLAASYTVGAWLATGSVRSALSPHRPYSSTPAAAPAPAGPAPAPAGAAGLDADTYKGGNGTLRVEWATGGLTYTAIITATGRTGRAVVSFSDAPGYAAAVQETLSLGGRAGDWSYVATDVRDLGPPIYAKTYRLDSFHLAPSGEGRVTVDRVCDAQGNACVQVTTPPG